MNLKMSTAPQKKRAFQQNSLFTTIGHKRLFALCLIAVFISAFPQMAKPIPREEVGQALLKEHDYNAFINKTGDVVIEGFSDVGPFSEEAACVNINSKYGYIRKTGKLAVNPNFDWAKDFSEGLAPVLVGNKWGFIDPTGKMVIEPRFDDALGFSEGDEALTGLATAYSVDWGVCTDDLGGRKVDKLMLS